MSLNAEDKKKQSTLTFVDLCGRIVLLNGLTGPEQELAMPEMKWIISQLMDIRVSDVDESVRQELIGIKGIILSEFGTDLTMMHSGTTVVM